MALTRLKSPVRRVVTLNRTEFVLTVDPNGSGPPLLRFRKRRGRYELTYPLERALTRAALAIAEEAVADKSRAKHVRKLLRVAAA